MRNFFSKMTMATAIAATAMTAVGSPAEARHRKHYYGRTAYNYKYCRHSSATTGAVAGGVGGSRWRRCHPLHPSSQSHP